jgi:lipoate-protein ligase A
MKLLELTLPTAAENVALDDALVEEADARGSAPGRDPADAECLRLWEPSEVAVVLGRSSRMAQEVDVEACRRTGATIVRRASGGATIVAGPGCLMYAVVLSYALRPELRAIDAAPAFVLGRLTAAQQRAAVDAARRGTSDLTLGPRKFSGNSMRCRRDFLLYHGTLLYDFPLDVVGELLKLPPREPDYRNRRGHREFIENLPLGADELRRVVAHAFEAEATASAGEAMWPRARAAALVAEKYGTASWTNLF